MRYILIIFVTLLLFNVSAYGEGKDNKYKTSDFYGEKDDEKKKGEGEEEEKVKGLLYDDQSFYSDIKPREYKEHDIITVIIEEKASASISTTTLTDKRTRVEELLEKFIRISDDREREGKFRILPAIREGEEPEIDLDARIRRDNTGDMTRDTKLSFRIAAEVVQVLPNGNLVIEARKERKINDETETMSITGMISPEDVDRTTNTIKSEKVANVKIVYNGEGIIGETQKRNILGKLIDFFFGF